MRLQVNPRGGWVQVCEFEQHQLRQVQEAIVILTQALATGARVDAGSIFAPSWRITADVARSPKIVAHLDPARGLRWRKA